jgi:hypothetical protein
MKNRRIAEKIVNKLDAYLIAVYGKGDAPPEAFGLREDLVESIEVTLDDIDAEISEG